MHLQLSTIVCASTLATMQVVFHLLSVSSSVFYFLFEPIPGARFITIQSHMYAQSGISALSTMPHLSFQFIFVVVLLFCLFLKKHFLLYFVSSRARNVPFYLPSDILRLFAFVFCTRNCPFDLRISFLFLAALLIAISWDERKGLQKITELLDYLNNIGGLFFSGLFFKLNPYPFLMNINGNCK